MLRAGHNTLLAQRRRRGGVGIFVCLLLLGFPDTAAPTQSWNRVRYLGGTVKVKASPHDWNTQLTVDRDLIEIEITPATIFQSKAVVKLKPAQVKSLSYGLRAWQRVADVEGATLHTKAPALFGLLADFTFVGIIYADEDGKQGGVLLQSRFGSQIVLALKAVTRKDIEDPP